MNAAIDIRDLHLAYGDRPVLSGVDLRVAPGEVVLVIGNSGCGKSALLKAILGLEQPSAGRVLLLGQELPALPAEEQLTLRRRLGAMFQYGALLSSLTVAENVALPLEMHTSLPEELIGDLVRTRLHQVGLGHAAGLYPPQLSGGMRKRAALARALALDPEILFCDEPVAALDPAAAAEIDHLLLTLNRSLGTTLVVVTHELQSIDRLGGRLILLDQGKVVFTGTLSQARESAMPVVARFFNPGIRR